MLTIRRGPGEGIVIGNSIVITVLEIDGERVRLVIEDQDNGAELRIVDWPMSSCLDADIDPGGEGI
jgi:hypothetical protein